MATVTVLMSTYNGEKYLEEQIDSIVKQEGVNIKILVRDDGSTDGTQKMLDQFQEKGILHWYTGHNLRSAKSFLDLVSCAPMSDYYAFCDQDDVWNSDKLYRAISKLECLKDDSKPKLYCSNYQLVDAELENLPDNGHISTVTFNAALVSSCCTGCTVVFDRKLLEILKIGSPKVVVMHDDWVHKVCLAVGGTVIYDDYKSLKYRQHGANVDGGVHNVRSKFQNIFNRIRSKDRVRSRQIGEILRIYRSMMPRNYVILADKIATYADKNIFGRIQLAYDHEIRTPYKRLNRGYRVAVILRYY